MESSILDNFCLYPDIFHIRNILTFFQHGFDSKCKPDVFLRFLKVSIEENL